MSSVESNETTAATVSCDLAPPPQRRRRRHPPPPPPRNLPSVTFPGSKETYLSLHNRVQRAGDIDRQLRTPCCRHRSSATAAPQHGAQQQTRGLHHADSRINLSTSISVKFVGRRYTTRPGAPTVVSGKHVHKVHS